MNDIIIGEGVHIGGTDTRSKTCTGCGRPGGAWSKLVVDGKPVWRHECGAEQ